nr:hypothetical protein [Tanacetum cinerariifolium]
MSRASYGEINVLHQVLLSLLDKIHQPQSKRLEKYVLWSIIDRHVERLLLKVFVKHDDDGEEAAAVGDGVDVSGVVEPQLMRWFKQRLSRVAVEMMMMA